MIKNAFAYVTRKSLKSLIIMLVILSIVEGHPLPSCRLSG